MGKLRADTVTGPAHWACYFINGDASRLDDADIARADAWVERNGCPVSIADDDEGRFTWSYDLYAGYPDAPRGGTVVDYIILTPEG